MNNKRISGIRSVGRLKLEATFPLVLLSRAACEATDPEHIPVTDAFTVLLFFSCQDQVWEGTGVNLCLGREESKRIEIKLMGQ